jgi:hypothetical protein
VPPTGCGKGNANVVEVLVSTHLTSSRHWLSVSLNKEMSMEGSLWRVFEVVG